MHQAFIVNHVGELAAQANRELYDQIANSIPHWRQQGMQIIATDWYGGIYSRVLEQKPDVVVEMLKD